ncbi:MAG TPA: phytoene/squalene synthase family protein [Chloroflexia bacterium]|nr:phytoene/squalene synthase family protein [Chloroflexia bacterium]
MEHNRVFRFTAPGIMPVTRYAWPHVAPINPPSSRVVLETLHDLLPPPTTGPLTERAITRGAYDGLAQHCDEAAHRPTSDRLWAYEACAAVIRQHSKSFYMSARLLPNGKRRGIMALYAFCRLSDDIVDRAAGQAGAAAAALDEWAAVNRIVSTGNADPVVLAWSDTRTRCSIPVHLADELIEGVRMDLSIERYATWNDLWVYCYRVASTVGLMSMYITGAETMDAVPYAVQLGIALQLTNILRDVGEDARAGRIYLPQEDMDRFGVSEHQLFDGVVNAQFVRLMQFQIERARALYAAAWPGIAMLPADSRTAVAAALVLYRGILRRIEQNAYDVFSRRAHLSMREKVSALPGIWWRVRSVR